MAYQKPFPQDFTDLPVVEQCILFAITEHYPVVCIDNNPACYALNGITSSLVYILCS